MNRGFEGNLTDQGKSSSVEGGLSEDGKKTTERKQKYIQSNPGQRPGPEPSGSRESKGEQRKKTCQINYQLEKEVAGTKESKRPLRPSWKRKRTN